MVNWKGFRRKECSLRKHAEICLEKPEKENEKQTQQSTTLPRFEPDMRRVQLHTDITNQSVRSLQLIRDCNNGMSQYCCALRTSAAATGRQTHGPSCNNSEARTGASQRYITVRPSVYNIMPSHAPQLCPQLSRTNNNFSEPEDRHKKCGPSNYQNRSSWSCYLSLSDRGKRRRGSRYRETQGKCNVQPCI